MQKKIDKLRKYVHEIVVASPSRYYNVNIINITIYKQE